jgi:hypothetical protein
MRRPVLIHSRLDRSSLRAISGRAVASSRLRDPDRVGGRWETASVDAGREDLGAFALGQPAPDSVGLVHLQSVRTARGESRTLETHGLRLGLASCARRPPFALRMEEERAGHPSARRVQLPVPQVSVRSGQASGVRHVVPLRGLPTTKTSSPRIDARKTARHSDPEASCTTGTELQFLDCSSRTGPIRADPGALDHPTLERFSRVDKTLSPVNLDLASVAAEQIRPIRPTRVSKLLVTALTCSRFPLTATQRVAQGKTDYSPLWNRRERVWYVPPLRFVRLSVGRRRNELVFDRPQQGG